MSSTILRSFTSYLIAIIVMTILSGCGGGTMDFVGEDTSTFVGSIEGKQKLSERTSIGIDYIATAGSNTQYVSTGVQENGIRFNDPANLNNSYTFQALTAHYEYTLFPDRLIRLLIAPGLQASYYTLSSENEDISSSFKQLDPAYGLKLGASINFSDRTRALAGIAFYDQRADNYYTTAGLWIEHDFSNNFGLKFGYSAHETGDGYYYTSDGCYTNASLAEECENSDVEIVSNGLHIGLKYYQ